MQLIDITNNKYGRLTVLEHAGRRRTKCGSIIVLWSCSCECGNKVIVSGKDLKKGHTQSCGCYQKEQTSKASKKHGMRHTKIYHIWVDMKNRCFNERNKRFYDWGGRGITVCDEWKDDFMAFYNYVSPLPHFGEDGYSIDRINNDGNYEPGNVRWATIKEQNNNKRRKDREWN